MRLLPLFTRAALITIFAATSAQAATISLNFNSLADGANAAQIQAYIQSQLGPGQTVAVSNGAMAERDYTGDGHVTGPCGPGCSSVTLGTDTFIRNVPGIPSFTFTFTGLTIDSVTFDYEIFPDGTCPDGRNNCGGNWPDFTFSTNLGTVFHDVGVMPSTTAYSHSPASGSSHTEYAPQLLVVGRGPLTVNVTGATSLTFADWPATIGIDNLTIITRTPEPTTMALLGTGLVGLFARRRKRS